MKVVFILTIAVMLPLVTFAGNCECDECLSEWRCGNSNISDECIDCVSSCNPTNNDCKILGLILFIICNVIWVCGCIGHCKWCNRNEEVKDKQSFCYKYCIKTILLVITVSGISGLIYFESCDCDDPYGCSAYMFIIWWQ